MFTKPTHTPITGFVAAVTRVRAGWFNYVANNFPAIVDGVGGGLYELVGEPLRFVSDTQKFKLNFPAALFPIELLGHVKVGVTDEPNYAAGQGSLTVEVPATFSSTVTYTGAIVYNNTITFNNVVTFASGADPVVQSGCAWTFQSGSSATFASGSSFVTAGLVTMTTTAGSSITIDAASSLVLSGSAEVTFASPSARSYVRGPSGVYMVEVSASQWKVPSGLTPPVGGAYEQGTDVTTGSNILWRMDVPSQSIVTGISIWVDPPAGHGGVLPDTVPRIRAYVVDAAAGTFGLIAGSDTSDPTLIASYEAAHQFASGVLAGNVGEGQFVVIAVSGEYGGSAQPGLMAYPPSVTFTRTKLGG
jgi:hypothetical protein